MNRIVDIGDVPARLRVEDGLLCVSVQDQPQTQVPLPEVAVLIVSHCQVSYTHAVLSRLAEAGGAFVACGEKHQPVGMLLPLVGQSTQAERMAAQAGASLPLRKQTWKRVVRAKLQNQGWALNLAVGRDFGVSRLAGLVRSGDPDNVEGQAARAYWPALLAVPNFHRDPGQGGVNAWLNYGYAVARAIVGRAVCAAGLHPSLGLHHHNRYDPFCLVSDLMEPFRPVTDLCVCLMLRDTEPDRDLDKHLKKRILEFMNRDLVVRGERRTMFSLAAEMAHSLAEVFLERRERVVLPRFEAIAPWP